MIQRAGYDLVRVGLRIAVQLWPLWLFWWAWDFANDQWVGFLRSFPGSQPGGVQTLDYRLAYWAWPAAALLGPLVVMVAGVGLFRMTLGSRTMALAGVVGMAVTAVLTGWSEYQRLWPYVGAPGVSYLALLNAFDLPLLIAVLLGVLAAIIGFYATIRPRPIGRRQSPSLLRGASDNFGHAAWLSMRDARKLFPGPDPAYGGIVVGEAYRVDEDRVARRTAFDPRDRRTWGRGGSQPLLVDPCRTGSTHALVLAGSGGFKTTSVGIPTLLDLDRLRRGARPLTGDRPHAHRLPPPEPRAHRGHAGSGNRHTVRHQCAGLDRYQLAARR